MTDPIFFHERFGLSPEQTGAYLASLTMLQSVAATFTGSVETVLMRRGWATLDIRRYSSTFLRGISHCIEEF